MTAKLEKLDDYVGRFYDENLDDKVKAARDILELFQNFNNLDELLEHGTSYLNQNHCFLFWVGP